MPLANVASAIICSFSQWNTWKCIHTQQWLVSRVLRLDYREAWWCKIAILHCILQCSMALLPLSWEQFLFILFWGGESLTFLVLYILPFMDCHVSLLHSCVHFQQLSISLQQDDETDMEPGYVCSCQLNEEQCGQVTRCIGLLWI